MTEKSSEKINFFKDVLKSIKDLDKYEDYALELPKNAFKYLLKLVLIFSAIICVCYTYQIVQNLNNMYESFKNILPDFSYTQGVLTLDSEETIVIEEYKDVLGKVIIDPNGTIEKYEQDKDVGILLLKDKCVVLSNSGIGQVTYNYEELAKNYGLTEFTKNDIINSVESINIISLYTSVYFVIFVYFFIIYFITIFMDVLLLSVLAYLVSRISRIRLKFAPSFSIAVHAITLSVILNLIYIIVNLFTGFEIKYFELMYSTISYIYVIVAILMIKTDFIQRQMELIKLAQEQEKVREEIKQKEEAEKEKQQEENKKPEEDKKENGEEKSSKKKKKSDGEDKAGANAPACTELEKEAKEQG